MSRIYLSFSLFNLYYKYKVNTQCNILANREGKHQKQTCYLVYILCDVILPLLCMYVPVPSIFLREKRLREKGVPYILIIYSTDKIRAHARPP